MNLRNLFERIRDNATPTAKLDRAVQTVAAVAAPLYGAGAWTRRVLHELGLRPRAQLRAKVLSVGNITLGGTGKTPFTVWLARWLVADGKRPAILSRGYGRENMDALTIVHDGRELRARTAEAGDEPVMMAAALKTVPVIACADRARAGRRAVKAFDVDTLVLDDGFQHVTLERQGDIVLLDASKPLTSLRLFPRGSLREPLAALSRAHLIVLTRCDDERRTARLEKSIKGRLPQTPLARTRFVIKSLVDIVTRKEVDAESLRGKPVMVVCGVGNPESVRKSVEKLGARVVGFRALSDHERPTKREVLQWDSERRRLGAEYLVVTEKDAVKIRELRKLPDNILVTRQDLEFLSKRDESVTVKALKWRLSVGGVKGLLK